jgi:hypothetical protein
MLGSITPLGQRGRIAGWSRTVGFYVAGSVAGGLLAGAVAGAFGAAVGPPGRAVALGIAALAALAAAVVDAALRGRPLPGPSRQVNEEWLHRYRGWVYGGGFGFQLGLGVATVVTTAGVYAALVIAAASGSVATGALIGATFGFARALPVLAARRVRSTDELLRMDAGLRRLQPLAVRSAAAGQAALGVAAIALAVLVR